MTNDNKRGSMRRFAACARAHKREGAEMIMSVTVDGGLTVTF